MRNFKTAVMTLIAIFTIAIFVAGCSKKETETAKQETNNTDSKPHDMNNMNTSKDVKSENKQHAMVNLPSMQCAVCKKNIETAVNKVDGIVDVNVDKKEKVAHINFDKSKTDIAKIENAITSAGYDANDKKKNMKAYEGLDDCCKLPKDQKDPGQH